MLLFSADDGIHGLEVWKSDGTYTGTTLLKDIFPGNDDWQPSAFTVANDLMFFLAFREATSKPDLWRTDGTISGTFIIKEASSTGDIFMTTINDWLFFVDFDEDNYAELWKSDGTITGTNIVKTNFSYPPQPYLGPTELANWHDTLFFVIDYSIIDQDDDRQELWKSNGTTDGTKKIQELTPNSNGTKLDESIMYKDKFFYADREWYTPARLWAYIPNPYRHYLPLIFKASP